MKQFAILDIRGPWPPAGRGRHRADAGRPAPSLDAIPLSVGVLPANASCPCGFLTQIY